MTKTTRTLPPRDATGRFVSARNVAAAADRARDSRRHRFSVALHVVGLVVAPWIAVAWMVRR